VLNLDPIQLVACQPPSNGFYLSDIPRIAVISPIERLLCQEFLGDKGEQQLLLCRELLRISGPKASWQQFESFDEFRLRDEPVAGFGKDLLVGCLRYGLAQREGYQQYGQY